MTTAMPQSLRADAQDNRERALDAARDLFGRSGFDVPMRAIADRAGLAVATLYRRFPTKQALVEAAFAQELAACRAVVQDAARVEDPWRGFCEAVERVLVLNATDQAFTTAFAAAFPDAFDVGPHRAELLGSIDAIARRAIAAGRLRPDFRVGDFVLVVAAGRGVAAFPEAQRVDAARRLAALAIDGFRRVVVPRISAPA